MMREDGGGRRGGGEEGKGDFSEQHFNHHSVTESALGLDGRCPSAVTRSDSKLRATSISV